ncbi:hypothetical protein ACN2EN_07000 [Aliarcobacter lanthieri]|uniref:hypothetical protein n=1 Tax=Aliarcobacter lanthieri TaxID=1355374 RepID=UPI003AFAF8C7
MSLVDISTINLIPKVLEEMQNLKKDIHELKQHLKPEYDLSRRNGVMKYLNISDSTISKYIKEGTFKEGYHYYREIKGRKSIIKYVSGAIEEFKKDKTK